MEGGRDGQTEKIGERWMDAWTGVIHRRMAEQMDRQMDGWVYGTSKNVPAIEKFKVLPVLLF